MPTYGSKWPQYAKQWDSMKIRPGKVQSFNNIAKRLIASKDRYLRAEKATGVPWYMIAVIHERESSQNWKTQLAQGDPLSRVSTHVPRGRGPFTSWEDGAYDALVTLKNYNRIKDWRLEKILYYLELYNGWGYHNKGVPSAYIWAGSTVYSSGKYVADGVWSSTAVDTQPGCASLIKIMMELDPTIQPKRETTQAQDNKLKNIVLPGSIIAAGTGVAVAEPHIWPWIIGGTLVAFLGAWALYNWIKKDE